MSDIRSYSKEFLTQFIELYKSLPALWKIKSKEYSDRNKKNEAYHILIEKLKEVEPNATRDTVTKKNNSLRSSRRKEQKKIKDSLRSGASTDDIYRTSLWYFELLEFVDDQETVRKPVSNFDSEDNSETALQNEFSDTGLNADEPSTSVHSTLEQRPSSQLSTTNSNDPQSSSNEVGRSSTTRAFPPRHSGKRGASEVDDTISAIGKRLNESKEDSHDTFGRNVAHKLRGLPNNQRIFLEKIINDAIFEAELGNLKRNCYVHIPTSSSLNVAVNPPIISIPVNRSENSTATTLPQPRRVPESQLIALQNNSIEFNIDPNDLSSLSQFIANYQP